MASPETVRAWRQTPKGRRHEASKNLMKRAGLTRTEAYAALDQKPDICDVCGASSSDNRICYDHCHVNGCHRGWLCSRCNLLLGQAGDDPQLLHDLANYLEGFNNE